MSTHDLTTRSRLHSCPDCGQTFEVQELTGLEWDGPNAAAYKAAMEKMFAMVICDDCVRRREGSEVERQIAMKARAARSASYGLKWLPAEARGECFAKSQYEHEIRTTQIEDAFAWARSWQPLQPKCSVWLRGSKGTGKSFLAHCLCNHAIDLGKTAREITALEVQRNGIMWGDGQKVLKQVRSVDVLLVEEVGLPDWRKEGITALREIIDYRHRNHLATIITSNTDIREMKAIWTEASNPALVDPMIDRMQSFVSFEFIGASLRKAI